MKQQIIESGATVIVRPDSGYPPAVVRDTLFLLDEKFGSTINSKGYKVLNHVRVIQGDGINENSIKDILKVIVDCGFSVSNVNFGMGGGLLQQLDRDTQKFAFKCSNVTVNKQFREVYKDPITDAGKRSKSGRLDLVKVDSGEFDTQKLRWGMEAFSNSEMVTVFEDGELLVDQNLDDIRERAMSYEGSLG